MSDPSWSFANGVRGLMNLGCLMYLLFGYLTADENPMLILISSTLFILIGIPLFIYGLGTVDRYKEVYDYEPTEFFGRATTGKAVRDLLTTFTLTGIWGIGTGILAMLLFILPKLM